MFTSLINLFYPPCCAGCESILLPNEPIICSKCRHIMPRTGHLSDDQNEAMVKCYGRIPVVFAAAFLHYQKKGIVQHLIHNLKYKGIETIGDTLAQWCAKPIIDSRKYDAIDCVIPVPLHSKRMRQRGYNQVGLFAKTLAFELGVCYDDALLYRNKYSSTQTKKNLLRRTDLSTEIFNVQYVAAHHDKHYLLIDDVITTGATLEACSTALLKIPGVKISIFCIAMSH